MLHTITALHILRFTNPKQLSKLLPCRLGSDKNSLLGTDLTNCKLLLFDVFSEQINDDDEEIWKNELNIIYKNY